MITFLGSNIYLTNYFVYVFMSATVDVSAILTLLTADCCVVRAGLERCAGEVITDMLTVIETCDPDEAQMRLIMRGKQHHQQLREMSTTTV